MASQLYEVAKTGDIPPGYIVSVEVEGEGIVICNVDGEFFAIADECTHAGGQLVEGELEGDIIECPRHGAQFNVRTGAVVEPPAKEPVDTYRVEVRGDTILVEVEPA